MLEGIVGNKSVAKILIFLFVNETCYGSQIGSLLATSLTPIQKALQRLEKENILISSFQGKLRIYELNPNYPFRRELESLLKKAYSLLPCAEKKRFCFIHKPRLPFKEEIKRARNKEEDLLLFWNKLKKVSHLSFFTSSKRNQVSSTQIGQANVEIVSQESSTLVFQEKGYWLRDNQPDTAFNNSFRWTLDLKAGLISLEHLRYGPAHPVFLFHLTPKEPFILEAIDAHLCAADTYLGTIYWSDELIDFHWRIIGPMKNDRLTYRYSSLTS